MAATVIRLPVAMKRGRKVTKGPSASITVLYYAPLLLPKGILPAGGREESMAVLLERIRARNIEEQAQALAWIDLSGNVSRWPESATFRTERQVQRLKEGFNEDDEDELYEMAREAREQTREAIQHRRAEIVAQAHANGGDHG